MFSINEEKKRTEKTNKRNCFLKSAIILKPCSRLYTNSWLLKLCFLDYTQVSWKDSCSFSTFKPQLPEIVTQAHLGSVFLAQNRQVLIRIECMRFSCPVWRFLCHSVHLLPVWFPFYKLWRDALITILIHSSEELTVTVLTKSKTKWYTFKKSLLNKFHFNNFILLPSLFFFKLKHPYIMLIASTVVQYKVLFVLYKTWLISLLFAKNILLFVHVWMCRERVELKFKIYCLLLYVAFILLW